MQSYKYYEVQYTYCVITQEKSEMVDFREIQKIVDQYKYCDHYDISMIGVDRLNVYLKITDGEHLIDIMDIKKIHFYTDKSVKIDFFSGGYISFDYDRPHVSLAF